MAQIVGEIVLHGVAYHTGLLVVPILTLGAVQCDRWGNTVPKNRLRWGGLFHREGSRIQLTADATTVIGGLIWVAGIGAFFLARWLSPDASPTPPP